MSACLGEKLHQLHFVDHDSAREVLPTLLGRRSGHVRRARRHAPTMFAITLLSLASTHPLDGQRVMLNGALPCVRLLNATGRVGCATPARAAIAPLTLANDAEDLSSLLSAPVDGEIAVAISAALFLPATIASLRRTFGVLLRGNGSRAS